MSKEYTHDDLCRLLDAVEADRKQCNYEKVVATLKQIIDAVIPQIYNGDEHDISLGQSSFKFQLVQAEALVAFLANDRLAGEKIAAALRYIEEYFLSRANYEYKVFCVVRNQNDIISGAKLDPSFIDQLNSLVGYDDDDSYGRDYVCLLPIIRRLPQAAEALKDGASVIELAKWAYRVQTQFDRCIDKSREFGDFLATAAAECEKSGNYSGTRDLYRYWLWHSAIAGTETRDKEYVDAIRLRLLDWLINSSRVNQKLVAAVWDEKHSWSLKPSNQF